MANSSTCRWCKVALDHTYQGIWWQGVPAGLFGEKINLCDPCHTKWLGYRDPQGISDENLTVDP